MRPHENYNIPVKLPTWFRDAPTYGLTDGIPRKTDRNGEYYFVKVPSLNYAGYFQIAELKVYR